MRRKIITTTYAKEMVRAAGFGIPQVARPAFEAAGVLPANNPVDPNEVTFWYRSDIEQYIARLQRGEPGLRIRRRRGSIQRVEAKPLPEPVITAPPVEASVRDQLAVINRKLDQLLGLWVS